MPGGQFNIMNRQPDGNYPQRKTIAQLRWGGGAAYQLGSDLEAVGCYNIGLFSVGILQQRQAGRAPRIILDSGDCGLDAVFVPFEVYQAYLLLIAAADTPGRDASIVIPPTGTFPRLDQVLLGSGFGNVAVIRIRDIARGRRQRSKRLYWHKSNLCPKSATWSAEPSFLRPDGQSVIGSAGYAVRTRPGETERGI